MTLRPPDPEAVNRFAAPVLQDWGGAHTVALAYIGDRLGMFRALAEAGSATSQALADRTGLDQRYLRKWAAAMAAAEYVEYDATDGSFSITPEQARVLAEDGHPSFLGGGFQYAQACVQRVPELMAGAGARGGLRPLRAARRGECHAPAVSGHQGRCDRVGGAASAREERGDAEL